MSNRTLRFRAVTFRFVTGSKATCPKYMITDNCIPFFRANQWLELKSIRKASTGREYAKKLATFLNLLDSHSI